MSLVSLRLAKDQKPFHSGPIMHLLAVISFVAVMTQLTTLALARVQAIMAQSNATPLEIVTMPVVMVGGAICTAVLFTWFVAQDRGKHIKRIDSLERSRRRTDKMFALIAKRLQIPADEIMEAVRDEEVED